MNDRRLHMPNTYTAITKKDGDWWGLVGLRKYLE
jgi:hypothetical protein